MKGRKRTDKQLEDVAMQKIMRSKRVGKNRGRP